MADVYAQRIAAIALQGEQTRGDGGVVLSNRSDDTASYVLVHELPSEELREVVGDLLTEEGRRYFFVLEEHDRKINIWKMDKASGNRCDIVET